MKNGAECPNCHEPWHQTDRDFPILPILPVYTVPTQELPTAGNHISEGERSELAVVDFFERPSFAYLVDTVKHVARNPHFDKQGIDARLRINTCTPEGEAIAAVVGRADFSLQVKTGERSAHHFVRDHAKRERDRTVWLEKGFILMNGTYPDEFKAADFALQLLLLSGRLFHQESIQTVVSSFPDDLRACMTHHYIIPPVLDARELLIRKFYPDFDPRRKQGLADLFIDAG